MKEVRIRYFALLREQCGKEKEVRKTESGTAGDLYDELQKLYGFSLDQERLWVAVNHEIVSWSHVLDDDDEVVFIPPVAGG